jgi:CHASE3 domain sensor protein
MDQMLINSLIAGAGGLVSFLLKRVYDALQELQRRDDQIANKINQIEVLLAGQYVNRASFDSSMHLIFNKLDSISEKLNNKADR